MISRLKFANNHGAICSNYRYAWSYINEDEKFIIFGAWEHTKVEYGHLIFSKSWERDENGRKKNAYSPSFAHIERIIEDGFKLFVFSQKAVPGTENGPAEIESFKQELEERKLLVVGNDYLAVYLNHNTNKNASPDPTDLWEGKSKEVLLTHYERNPQARKDCLDYHGYSCTICEFDFSAVFGLLGKGYIHVHHIIPVASRKRPYIIDGKKDLIPLCPNCHAMIHKRVPPYSIQELKHIISEQRRLTP